MATSRYDTPTTQQIGGTVTGGTSGTSTTDSTGAGTTSNNGTSSSTTTSNNLTASQTAALNTLISQLLNGGTPEMQQEQAIRNGEIGTVQGIRGDYSKTNAFTDAQGLISQQMRRTLEQLLPSINHAAEDAGSSGGALRALLLQDAANKAAESSSALGVQTAEAYGNISASLSSVLENLTKVNPAAADALVAALNVAKGATSTSTTNGTTSNNGTTSQNNTSTTSNQNNTTQTSTPNTTSGATVTSPSTTPIYFGPTADSTVGTGGIGSTLDTLMQLANGSTAYKDYVF